MADLQITIDDGPLPYESALIPILTELQRRNVLAAFFVLGSEVAANATAAQTIKKFGHVLGNHSWDHLEPSTARLTDAQILDQFRRTHEAVRRATSVTMQHWRAPRLEQISRLARLLTQGPSRLYTLSHTDMHADSRDGLGAHDAAAMLRALRSDLSSRSSRRVFRLLFHVKPTTASAFRAVLEGLVSDGHRLVNFSQTS